MPTTANGLPDKFSPVFNPLVFYLNSNLRGNQGFKYIADIFPAGNTTDRIVRIKLFPRPSDLFGVLQLDSILKSQVSHYINQDLHSFANSPVGIYSYDVVVGEEYVKYWSFSRNYSVNGYLTLSGLSSTHLFQLGDQITIAYNPPNPAVDGTHTVLDIPSSNAIIVDGVGVTNAAAFGTVVYADQHKNVFSGQTTYSNYNVFNGAVPHQSFMSYTSSTYSVEPAPIPFNPSVVVSGSESYNKFLTNVPNGYNIRPENSVWLNFYVPSPFTKLTLEVTTNLGTFYYPSILSSPGTMQTVAVGPKDLQLFQTSAQTYDYNHTNQANAPKFDCNTTEYKVRLVRDLTPTGDSLSSFYLCTDYVTFKYNQDNTGKNNNVELYFMDRLGSIVPCNFELLSARSISKTDANYKTIIGNLNTNTSRFEYQSTEAGTRTINQVEVQQLTVATNWMSEAESNYFKELFTTKVCYIKEFGKLWPVIVKDSTLSLPTKANKKNLNRVLLIEYANNNPVQN